MNHTISIIKTIVLMNISKRYGHNGCIINFNNIQFLFIFGGYSDTFENLDNVTYVLNTTKCNTLCQCYVLYL